MIGALSRTNPIRKLLCRTHWLRLGAIVCVVLAAGVAMAQEPPSAPPPDMAVPPAVVPSPPAPVPNHAFGPGFIDALGRWLGNSKATIDEHIKGTQEAIGGIGSQATDAVGTAAGDAAGAVKDAAGAAQQATGVIVGLPNTRVVVGRQLCPLAANGAPDCAPAALALCKHKGFAGGRGLDIDSAQKCPAWIWLSGRSPEKKECRTETFVTRAVCQ